VRGGASVPPATISKTGTALMVSLLGAFNLGELACAPTTTPSENPSAGQRHPRQSRAPGVSLQAAGRGQSIRATCLARSSTLLPVPLCSAVVRNWPISEATAAGRGVCLLIVYLSPAWRATVDGCDNMTHARRRARCKPVPSRRPLGTIRRSRRRQVEAGLCPARQRPARFDGRPPVAGPRQGLSSFVALAAGRAVGAAQAA
jgi:hypothetical protein